MAISLDAGLAVQLGQTLDDLRQVLARRMKAERQFPRYLEPPYGFSVPATASSLTVADLGGPNQGRIWQVDRFTADVSPLGSTRPTGITVYLFTGPGQQQGSTQLNPAFFTLGVNNEAAYTAYPVNDRWSSRQFVVQFPEHLLVGVLQPPAGFSGGAIVQVNQAGTGAASAITLTVPAVAGQINQVSGFTVSGTGATAGSTIVITLAGVQGGTQSFDYVVPAGAAVAAPTLAVTFPVPLVASGPNVAIVLTVPSFGAGNLASAAELEAQQLTAGAAVHQIAGQVAITDLVIHEDEPFVDPVF